MKKALLTVSFGTTYREARIRNIDACERRLAGAFPDRTPFRAFTSGRVLRKLAQRDGAIHRFAAAGAGKTLAAGVPGCGDSIPAHYQRR